MNPVYIKRRGNVATVYLDNGNPLPIAHIDDEPLGFPYTGRPLDVAAQFPGREIIWVEDRREPTVSGVVVSDEKLAMRMPEARKEMGEHKPIRVGNTPYVPAKTEVIKAVPETTNSELDVFREYIRRWHYAKGKEKKEIGRDIEAIASFLIELNPSIEMTLERIKAEETSERKRFSL